VSGTLETFEAITKHLTATQSGQVYRDDAGLSMNVPLDFPAAVTLYFRPSGVMRASMALPIRVTAANREACELTAQTLNRTALGVSVIVGQTGLPVCTQVPIGRGALTSRVLDRTIALCIEHAKRALPILHRVAKTGLASI
jgi:hypothetical protein